MARVGLGRAGDCGRAAAAAAAVGPRRVRRSAAGARAGWSTTCTRRRPVDPRLAVYAAYWYRGVSCNPAAIDAKAAELAPQVRGVWVVDAAHAPRMPPAVLCGRRVARLLPDAWPGPVGWSTT